MLHQLVYWPFSRAPSSENIHLRYCQSSSACYMCGRGRDKDKAGEAGCTAWETHKHSNATRRCHTPNLAAAPEHSRAATRSTCALRGATCLSGFFLVAHSTPGLPQGRQAPPTPQPLDMVCVCRARERVRWTVEDGTHHRLLLLIKLVSRLLSSAQRIWKRGCGCVANSFCLEPRLGILSTSESNTLIGWTGFASEAACTWPCR